MDTGMEYRTRQALPQKQLWNTAKDQIMDSIVPDLELSPISVVIASKGRPDCVSETIKCLERQTLKPREIIVVVPAPEDLPANQWGKHVRYVVGPLGLTTQRNSGIETIPANVKYVGCFDADFELKAAYLEKAVAFLYPTIQIVGMTGRFIKDRAITRVDAKKLSAHSHPQEHLRQPSNRT